ncbi:MAG: DUF374 domain-containing protein [Myxococcota bacterium]
MSVRSAPRAGHPAALSGVLSQLGAWVLRGLRASWRVRFEGDNPLESQPGCVQIAAIWHRDALITAALFRDRGFTAPVSWSRDGELIAATLARLGYAAPPRGSTSRGGPALLRGLVRRVEEGVTIAVPADGPRGPARRSKLGVVSVARLSGVAITPLSFSGRPCLRFGSWDGMLLPLPFARVICRFGEFLAVPSDANPEQEEVLLAELDRRLNRGSDELDDRLGLRDANRPLSDSGGGR